MLNNLEFNDLLIPADGSFSCAVRFCDVPPLRTNEKLLPQSFLLLAEAGEVHDLSAPALVRC